VNAYRKLEDFLPADIAVEQALIGRVLMRNDAWLDASEIVEPLQFSEMLHSRMWDWISQKLSAGDSVTPLTMGAALGPDAKAEIAPGMTLSQYLARIVTESVGEMINPAECAKTIRDLWRRRQIITLAGEMQQRAIGGFDGEGVDALLDDMDQELGAIRFGKEISGVTLIGDAAEQAVRETANAYQSDRKVGFDTGLPTLDELIGPMMPGDLISLGGPSGAGKSALAAQILRHNAQGLFPQPGFFLSMEMSASQIVRREMAADTRISMRQQKTGAISQGEYEYLRDAAAAMKSLPIHVDDSGRMKTSQIVKRLRAMKKRYNIGIAVLDNIPLIEPERDRWTDIETIKHAMPILKDTAKELGISLIAIAQVTRESMKRTTWRIRSSSIFGGEIVKQCSDIMASVVLPFDWLKENEPDGDGTKVHDKWLRDCEQWKDRAELGALKVRDDKSGGVRSCVFDGKTVRFSEER
jgi:replicative DNA helicase